MLGESLPDDLHTHHVITDGCVLRMVSQIHTQGRPLLISTETTEQNLAVGRIVLDPCSKSLSYIHI